MTDIVERLRAADISGYGTYSALVREAAAEIERLRAAVVWHCEACGTVTRSGECDCTQMETGTQRLVPYDYRAVYDAEIERLKDRIKELEAIYVAAEAHVDRLQEQIESRPWSKGSS